MLKNTISSWAKNKKKFFTALEKSTCRLSWNLWWHCHYSDERWCRKRTGGVGAYKFLAQKRDRNAKPFAWIWIPKQAAKIISFISQLFLYVFNHEEKFFLIFSNRSFVISTILKFFSITWRFKTAHVDLPVIKLLSIIKGIIITDDSNCRQG